MSPEGPLEKPSALGVTHPMRACEECGGELVRRAKEAPSKWAMRRYCSKACALLVAKRHLWLATAEARRA